MTQSEQAEAEAVAKWCGYRWYVAIGSDWQEMEYSVCNRFEDPTSLGFAEIPEEKALGCHVCSDERPNFAASLDAMREVENEIERRGLMGRYVEALWHGHAPGICYREEYIAFGLRATPAQRLEAAYRVIQEAALAKVMEESNAG